MNNDIIMMNNSSDEIILMVQLVHEFIFIVLFVNLYIRNLYRCKIKNRKKNKKQKWILSVDLSFLIKNKMLDGFF